MEKKRFCIFISEELRQELKIEADELGLSLNAYITMILMKRKK